MHCWAELGAPQAIFLKIAWAGAELWLGWTVAGRTAGENFENCLGWGWGWAGLDWAGRAAGESFSWVLGAPRAIFLKVAWAGAGLGWARRKPKQ